ncbi:hypothetical protein BsWGS_01452 [Bradybaena similaris]
MLSGKV